MKHLPEKGHCVLGIKGTQRVRESLVLSSGYVVLIVVAVLSNYPALSRLRHHKHRSRSLAGWVTEDVFWVLVIVCCSQSSPAPHLLRIFWPTSGAKWRRAELPHCTLRAHHRSVTGLTISITLVSPIQPVTLSTLSIQDCLSSSKNEIILSLIVPFPGISCLSKSVINLGTRGGGELADWS